MKREQQTIIQGSILWGVGVAVALMIGGLGMFATAAMAQNSADFNAALTQEHGSVLQAQQDLNTSAGQTAIVAPVPTSATAQAAPADTAIYVTRYLPDIVKGAKGPADLVALIYRYLMGIVGIVAVGVIMYGGVLRTISADPGKIRASTEYIKNALKGIVLLFGAQILFNTINPNIIDIQRIQRILQPSERINAGALTQTQVSVAEGGTTTGGATGGLNATTARSELTTTQGVTLLPECKTGGSTSGCITLQGIKPETLDAMRSMAAAGIPVNVTSVTEGAHQSGTYSHANGYKWDMKPIDQTYFEDNSQFQKIATRSDSYSTFQDTKTGAICSLEKPPAPLHWDCSVQ